MSTRARLVICLVRMLSLLGISVASATASAQDWRPATSPQTTCTTTVPSMPSGASLFDDVSLTRDWFGVRSTLVGRGVSFDLSTTQYYQGLAHGGQQQAFQYGGRNDYVLNLDGEKAGLCHGSTLTVHGESRYGESANSLTGALSPVNLMLSVPLSTGSVSGLTGVKYTQVLSENTLVYAGKLNTLDDFKQPLTGAGPLSGFQNSALIYNPVYARTIPYSTFGAGFAYLKNSERVFEAIVYDTNNTPTVSGFNTLFNNGATVYAQGTLITSFFEKPGHQGISGTYSTGTYTDLTPTAFLDPTNGLVLLSTPVQGSWCLTYNFDQAISVSRNDPQRMWGVFGNLGMADNNPSPVRWFASSGVSGTSPNLKRTADTFGAALFYIGASNSLKNPATDLISLQDEYGVEFYYNAAVTKWFQITPDVQVVRPLRERSDVALLVGLRAKIDF